jgi:cell division transport system permease protein
VPPSGFTARLTLFTAAAMAFLAVFALALSLAAGRLAERWSSALAGTATIRISAPPEQLELQARTVLLLLSTTPGIATARALDEDEQRALLAPWFGPDLPVEALPLPRLIEVTEDATGYDAEGLRQRLAAEAPGAVLDDHTRWRRPMVLAADRLRLLGVLSLVLIAASTAAMITLAANAALAANLPVIRVLRQVGAKDTYIVRAFVRRFTLRALGGAAIGTVLAMIGVALLPRVDEAGGFLTGLGFVGVGWLLPLLLPLLAAMVAFVATRIAAFRTLKGMT